MGEGVEERVGGRVVTERLRSPYRCRRGEEHEEVQLELPGQLVQDPGARYLRSQHVEEGRNLELREWRQCQDAGRVHHAAQWRQRPSEGLEHPGHRGGVAGVGSGHRHRDAEGLESANRLDTLTRGPRQLVPPRARGQARPAREDEVAGPSLHEPACHLQAEAAHASGD